MNRPIARLRNGLQLDGRPETVATLSIDVYLKTPAGILLASGATKPVDATAGYAVGCLFTVIDGATSTVYANEGDHTSCKFATGVVSTGDITSVVAGTGLAGGGTNGAVTVSLSVANLALLAIIAGLPTADATDGVTVWNDGGVLKVSTSA